MLNFSRKWTKATANWSLRYTVYWLRFLMVTLRRCGSRYCQLTSGTPSPYPTTYPRTSASPLGGRQLTTTELEKAVVVTSIGCPGSAVSATVNQSPHRSWRRGGVRRMNEVNARLARLVLGWVTASSGGCTISACRLTSQLVQLSLASLRGR